MTNLHSALVEGSETLPSSVATQNELLAGLLAISDPNRLLAESRVVQLTANQVLYEQGDTIECVYFPLDCVISGMAIMEDGTTVETSMIGREGLVGISSVLGSGVSRDWTWVLTNGNALQLEVRSLDKVIVNHELALKTFLKGYRSLLVQVSQRCVCNTRHTILERLSCWLLMIHDRVGGTNLKLTQEMIASRVGARRAGITVAAGILQEMGGIEYRRGQLHISNRKVLDRAVCECYSLMRPDFGGRRFSA